LHSDRIELRGLRARGRHGVLPAERELGQEFVVDVVLGLDTRPAAAGDDLSRTVGGVLTVRVREPAVLRAGVPHVLSM
jgi:dihydroneopterin aldolase